MSDHKVAIFMNCVAGHLFSGSQHVRQKVELLVALVGFPHKYQRFQTLAMLNTCADILGVSLSTLLYTYRDIFATRIGN